MLTCTAAMALLFGANAVLFLVFQTAKLLTPTTTKSDALEATTKKEKKELSKPFLGTFDCFLNLTSELYRCGLILGLTYICEFHPFFEHSGKDYSRDLFAFVLILFFAYAAYTIKPIHDLSLLGREQTEEWKGWMQFIFLLYHYFHAEEVYNSVRVMITCYVWMTGFGNFSFFYMKQDYGWLRLVQMLWRLNFSVLLLMWTHGNTYILYYICPMHTFYFFMVYATMYVMSSVNYSKWGIRIKLFVVGILIYLIWDINKGLFDVLFAWLGTTSVIGAGRGSVWEYYFRTSLDHYSSFFGMIFALNFPLAEQYFNKAKGWPLVVSAILMGTATILWFVFIYSKDKLEYNLTHSYTAIIPLTSYIFFRNITPAIRSGVSMSLHDLGKTTLETYLLQHHIWLTSNAKTLLTIVPGHPWINFALATLLFFTVSKELYRITMSVRGMIMPDDETIAYRNIIGTIAVVGSVFCLAYVTTLFNVHPFDLMLCAATLGLVALVFIRSVCRSLPAIDSFNTVSARVFVVGTLLILAGSAYSVVHLHSASSTVNSSVTSSSFDLKTCLNSATDGFWVHQSCPVDIISPLTARCQAEKWEWRKSDCPLTKISTVKARNLFKNKKITFIGDSIVRKTFHQFNELLDADYKVTVSKKDKHADLSVDLAENTTVYFKWAPYASNLTDEIHHNVDGIQTHDFVFSGVAPWDALNVRDLNNYFENLQKLTVELNTLRGFSAWILPTIVVDDLLPTVEKQQYMNQAVMVKYRESVKKSDVVNAVKAVLDPSSSTISMESNSADGLHYMDGVYDVIVQMTLNAYVLHNPALLKPVKAVKVPLGPKPTGSMSFPGYGAYTLILAAVMIFLMDSYLGFGWLALTIFGRSYDWNEAYYPLHKKLGVVTSERPGSIDISNNNNSEESKGFLEEKKTPQAPKHDDDDAKSV